LVVAEADFSNGKWYAGTRFMNSSFRAGSMHAVWYPVDAPTATSQGAQGVFVLGLVLGKEVAFDSGSGCEGYGELSPNLLSLSSLAPPALLLPMFLLLALAAPHGLAILVVAPNKGDGRSCAEELDGVGGAAAAAAAAAEEELKVNPVAPLTLRPLLLQ
jgi:hypothetical protein